MHAVEKPGILLRELAKQHLQLCDVNHHNGLNAHSKDENGQPEHELHEPANRQEVIFSQHEGERDKDLEEGEDCCVDHLESFVGIKGSPHKLHTDEEKVHFVSRVRRWNHHSQSFVCDVHDEAKMDQRTPFYDQKVQDYRNDGQNFQYSCYRLVYTLYERSVVVQSNA